MAIQKEHRQAFARSEVFAQMLGKLPDIAFEVIFTTSYDDYTTKAIGFSALDYWKSWLCN